MNVLVVGGSGSGKSAFAERLSCQLAHRRRYVATMASQGQEARARIARHRAQRADGGFATIECPQGTLSPAIVAARQDDGVVLLDDLGNLVANALFSPRGVMADPAATLGRLDREIDELGTRCAHLVVVGNEVGSEGTYADEGTDTWVRLCGALCCRLAARFDTVVEVVAGVPLAVKGGPT